MINILWNKIRGMAVKYVTTSVSNSFMLRLMDFESFLLEFSNFILCDNLVLPTALI